MRAPQVHLFCDVRGWVDLEFFGVLGRALAAPLRGAFDHVAEVALKVRLVHFIVKLILQYFPGE